MITDPIQAVESVIESMRHEDSYHDENMNWNDDDEEYSFGSGGTRYPSDPLAFLANTYEPESCDEHYQGESDPGVWYVRASE